MYDKRHICILRYVKAINSLFSNSEIMKITLDDLILFYGAKKINAACNVCGNEKWTMLEAPADYNFALGSTRDDGGLTVPFPTIPVVTLMCENCYNLRIHAAHPIADMKKSK